MERCAEHSCENNIVSRGYCQVHYYRRYYRGEFREIQRRSPGEPLKFLLANVLYRDEQCLLWPFYLSPDGYGRVTVDGKGCGAHRAMCTFVHGPPPFAGAHAAHSCKNGRKGCVAPNHLRWATPSENEADKQLHGTSPSGERNWSAKLTNEQALSIYRDCRPRKDIALAHGCAEDTVKNIKRGAAWAHVTGHVLVPASVLNSKGRACALTEQQVLTIAKDNRGHAQIGRDYAVSSHAVSLIKRGKRWAWLTGINPNAS